MSTLGLATLATAVSAQNLRTNASLAVFKLTKDSINETGDRIVEMMQEMEQSVNPHVGGNIDLRA